MPPDAMCRRFCSEPAAVVVSVNYRRAPGHRDPAVELILAEPRSTIVTPCALELYRLSRAQLRDLQLDDGGELVERRHREAHRRLSIQS